MLLCNVGSYRFFDSGEADVCSVRIGRQNREQTSLSHSANLIVYI
jgi:hypothetical protein